jgi:uncharacterized protein
VSPAELVLAAVAAIVAGAVNAIAGGGSLITFPVLVALGLPAVTASMTNTVAMCPGYLGATFAQRRELAGQGRRALLLLPLAVAGSLLGAYLLLHSGERTFRAIVPFLLVFAALLLAAQGRLRALLVARLHARHAAVLAAVPIGAAAIYGAYFGAALGVILLAVLAVVFDDTLVRANALKQLVSLVINVCAAAVFIAAMQVEVAVTIVVGVGSLVGGWLGGRLVRRIPEALLRWTVVAIALAVATVYFVRL